MGRYSENQFFQGNIDNKNIRDFFKLDSNKKSTQDRIDAVDEILDSSEYFMDFFSDYFKVNVNSGDALSEDLNVCQTLERMANYILSSEEELEHNKKEKPVYVFHKRRDKFEDKMNREKQNSKSENGSIENITENENIVHAVLASSKNSRLPKVQTITKKDLEAQTKTGKILRDYQVFLDLVDEKLKNKPDKKWRYYSNAKGQIKDDMINVKNMLDGVWGFNIDSKDSTVPDMDIFDFTDFNTIRYLLSMKKPSLIENYDDWILWHDFNKTVEKANFTITEKAVLALLQLEYSMVDIARELDIDYNRLRRSTIENMIKKVSKVGDKYDAEDPLIEEKIKKRKELNKENERKELEENEQK